MAFRPKIKFYLFGIATQPTETLAAQIIFFAFQTIYSFWLYFGKFPLSSCFIDKLHQNDPKSAKLQNLNILIFRSIFMHFFYFIVTKSSGSIPISIWFLLSVTLFCSQCRRKTCQLAGVISCCPQINPLFPYNSSEKFMNIIQIWPKCPDSAYQV